MIALLAVTALRPVMTVADTASAVGYLQAQQTSEWATMALVAAGQTNLQSDYLKTFSGTTVNQYAKRILAITSLGESPRTFASVDLVAGLSALAQGNQLGDPSLLNDDAWGVLALISAGISAGDPLIANSKTFLLANQNADGGWGYAPGQGSDVDDTAAVLMALAAAGVPKTQADIIEALTFLRARQNSDAGFPSVAGGVSNSGSTSWAVSALFALAEDMSAWNKGTASPLNFLWSLQTPDGSFKWVASDSSGSLTMTAFSLVALSSKWYPVPPVQSQPPAEHAFRIEGSSAKVCQGRVAARTALDIVTAAAAQCNFTYEIEQTGFGPYLKRINSDTASGTSGWLYRVNWVSPQVGANDYVPRANDEVLWYFGEFTWLPLRLTLSSQQVAVGANVTATVEQYSDGTSSWSALSGATVAVNGATYTTDSSGQASFSIGTAGSYQIGASATSAVRAAGQTLIVGGVSQAVGLSVQVNIPQPPGPPAETIAFSVSSGSLDFGSLQPGESQERTLTLANTGNVAISIQPQVSGDAVFSANLTVDGQAWAGQQYSLGVAGSKTLTIRLSVPGSTSNGGAMSGQVVFWAVKEF